MRWRTAWVLLATLIYSASSIAATAAGLTIHATFDPGVVETGFKLHASHGYSISVVAFSKGEGHTGTIEITARRHSESVSYRAPAIVRTDALRAVLGGIARIDLVRRPSGREKTVHSKCLGPQTYEPATYEGVIDFNGEEGYTRARQTRVAQLPPSLVFVGYGSCHGSGYGEVFGPGEPGARLRGVSFAHGRSLSFEVKKNSPRARTVFTASLKERRRGILIDRELAGVAPPSVFRFDRYLRTAMLSPRAPFTGSASLSRRRNSVSPNWTGNLKLGFPGHSGVALAGPGVHVSLLHARFTQSRGPNAEIGF